MIILLVALCRLLPDPLLSDNCNESLHIMLNSSRCHQRINCLPTILSSPWDSTSNDVINTTTLGFQQD